ncbi:IlvD/Edd family dehydratase [Nocardioides sambongensis]|uniref:IlvD/Edd family dehydratase n=1 Tax=Nocardioides sambongensis TaxID=2589074 RepID=UPI001125CCE1|nr:IlvD/Edd family dehydratase [Nocardioides sambongensis]
MSDTTGLGQGLTNYGDSGFSMYLRKVFVKGAGYTDEALERPVVGIVNTDSRFNPCHGNSAQLIDAVRRGVLMAGGLPMEFPTISVHESFSSPTSMYLRNLMSMDTEEMIRAQPMDSVVLIGGCDKTVPAQLMGAASANIPAIQLVTGSMLTGGFRGTRVGACTDCRFYWGQHRAGEMDAEEINDVSSRLAGSVGTCSVMGTASTMACIAEALGMALPGSASPPAVTADRMRVAEQTGTRAVQMVGTDLTPQQIITPTAIRNAVRVLAAIGGSTNAVVHLAAIAGRVGLDLDLDELDELSRRTPVLLDLKPSGQFYMEDFHRAGGVPVLMEQLRDQLELEAPTITGHTLGENLDGTVTDYTQDVIQDRGQPIHPEGGIAVVRGNLAPGGAIVKQSAADPALMQHEGRAVVFRDSADLAARIDDPDLDVRADDVLVLQNIGPVGAPGMPEAGYIPIPRKLAREGVRDMVRISDGRMSGTAAGTIVLHVVPESAVGGPLRYVRDGDRIRLDVAGRSLELLVDDEELDRRRADDPPSAPTADRGYRKLYVSTVLQADQGADFDFLRG